MADRYARRDAAVLSPQQRVGCLRDNAEHPWKPPGAGVLGALSHDVIHGLDVTAALDLDRHVPEQRAGQVLEQLAGLAALGVSHVQTQVPGVADIAPLEVFAERIIPAAAKL